MKISLLTIAFCVSIGLVGCGGAQNVVRTNTSAPEQIRTAALSPLAGNSPEVDSYVSDALLSQGVSTAPPLPAGTRKSADVDAVVTYQDVWRWDMAMYLKSISISLYDGKTGSLLVTGKWTDSLFHAWHRGESVSKELIAEMFSKLGSKTESFGQAKAEQP